MKLREFDYVQAAQAERENADAELSAELKKLRLA